METRVLNGTTELAKVFREWCGKARDIRIVTAWATTDCAVSDCLKTAHSKITTMIVGLDFYTTSPSFLHTFRSVIRIGTALAGGTFHPKLYFFENKDGFCCVMGSSNFTSGGFSSNTELNICIEGATSDPVFQQISAFIDEQEKHSEAISKSEIADYRDQFEKWKDTRKKLAKFHMSPAAETKAKVQRDRENAGEDPPEQLNKTWPEFVQLILASKRKRRIAGTASERGYLDTAGAVRNSLRNMASLQGCRSLTGNLLAERRGVGAGSRPALWSWLEESLL